jgi:hypothetical protein
MSRVPHYSERWLEENRDRVVGDIDSGPCEPSTSSTERASPEHDMQSALFELCAYHEKQRPPLAMIYATPNGQYRPGQRPEPGMKSGVPDITLPWAASGYHGLYLELKAPGKYPRPEQREWLENLRAAGYAARVARSVDEAWSLITVYLDGTLDPLSEDDSG